MHAIYLPGIMLEAVCILSLILHNSLPNDKRTPSEVNGKARNSDLSFFDFDQKIQIMDLGEIAHGRTIHKICSNDF